MLMSRLKEISLATIKLSCALLLFLFIVIPPAIFLKKQFEPQKILEYEAKKTWAVRKGEVLTYPGCAYILFGHYIAYCADDSKNEATDDLDSVPIDKPILIKESFLSSLFDVPTTPLESEVCFEVENYFADDPNLKFNSETRLFIYSEPTNSIRTIVQDDTKIITLKDRKCIKAMSGMTLIALGPGVSQIFDEDFYKGLLKTGKLSFLKENSNQINYSFSGGVLYINGEEVGGRLIEVEKGQFMYSMNLYKDSIDFDIVKKLVVTMQISLFQKIILSFVVFSVWLILVVSFVENLKKFFKLESDLFRKRKNISQRNTQPLCKLIQSFQSRILRIVAL